MYDLDQLENKIYFKLSRNCEFIIFINKEDFRNVSDRLEYWLGIQKYPNSKK